MIFSPYRTDVHPRGGFRWQDCRYRHLVCKAVNGATLASFAVAGTVIVVLAIAIVILLTQRRRDRVQIGDLDAEVQDLRTREQRSRDDAVRRSRTGIVADVTQHFAAMLPGFPYNPRDFQWIGGALDGVVFSTASKQAAKSRSSSSTSRPAVPP